MIQDFQRNRRRSQVAINEEHFLFGADSRHASLKEAGFDHVFKGAQVLKQRLHEGLRLALVKQRVDVVFAHTIFRKRFTLIPFADGIRNTGTSRCRQD